MRQRGFTLVEAMVALTILVLLLVAGAPSVSDFIRNQRIRTVAESLQAGLQRARAEAVRRNTSVSFWLVSVSNPTSVDNSCALSSTSGSWVISVSSPAGACAALPSTTTAPMLVEKNAIGNAGAAIAISAMESDGTTAATTVTFNGLGQVANADAIARITLQSASSPSNYRQLRLDISTAGDVRMCDVGVTDSTDPRYCSS
jgi:type IV fimbrial biogenesis protein FimT